MKKVIILLMLIGLVQAQVFEDIFIIEFTIFRDNKITVNKFELRSGSPTVRKSTPPGEFTMKILSDETELFIMEIPLDRITHEDLVVPCEDVGIDRPGEMCMTGKEIILDEITKLVRIPYMVKAETLQFLMKDEILLSFNIREHLCKTPNKLVYCKKPICGDNICEDGENCPEDCNCGNSICDAEENYGDCPQDCDSGNQDNYCDALKDGRCDPDCNNQDIDCKKGFPYRNALIFFSFVLLLGIIIAAIKKFKLL